MKRTALLTWEIGLGFGHIMPMLPLARDLKSKGWRCVFALKDVREAGNLLRQEDFELLQAPFHLDKKFSVHDVQPQTMADVLEIFGFSHEQHLAGLVYAWNNLLNLVKPDLLVASYAPLSLLCARARGIKTKLLALPFELPPMKAPLPSFRNPGNAVSGVADARIIQTVNKVLPQVNLKAAYEIFQADETQLLCLRELDAFAEQRIGDVKYSAPVFVTDLGPLAQWLNTGKPKVFAYLTTELQFLEKIRQEILISNFEFFVVLRGATDQQLKAWQTEYVKTVNHTVRLDAALKECQAVLSYGGMGMTSAALLAGKPTVFITRDLEGWLTAGQAEKLGAGLHANRRKGVKTMSLLSRTIDERFLKALSNQALIMTNNNKNQRS